jgi:hypothetical protein
MAQSRGTKVAARVLLVIVSIVQPAVADDLKSAAAGDLC